MTAGSRTYQRIGGQLCFFPSLDSTNTTAYEMARDGAPEGTVVIADAQSRGRGRLDRTWQSPPGSNLYLSVVLRPAIAPSDAPQITLMAGVAVAELLDLYCPGLVAIKWPNDILIRNRKICGILTEMGSSPRGVAFVVLGMGINVNMAREDFDPILQETATSLKMETGQTVDRLRVAGDLFQSVEKWYRVFLREGFPGIRQPFLAFSRIVGQGVQVVFRDDIQTGVVEGFDDDGAILMQDRNGTLRRITAGDVHIVKG